MRRLLLILIVLLLLTIGSLPVAAQDAPTTTYVNEDGVVIEYPANWVWSDVLGIAIFFSNSQSSLDTFAPQEGGIVVTVLYGTPSELNANFALIGDDAESVFENLVNSQPTAPENIFRREQTSVADGRIVYLQEGVFGGQFNGVYVLAVAEQIFVFSAITTSQADLEAYAPTILAMIASVRIDTTATPTTNTTTGFSTAAAIPAEPPFVWVQTIDLRRNSELFFALLDVWATPDGVRILDGFATIELDIDSGVLDQRALLDTDQIPYGAITQLPNGELWAIGFEGDVARFDPAGLLLIQYAEAAFGDDEPTTITSDAEGNVYVFARRDTDGARDGVIYTITGGDITSFIITEAVEDGTAFDTRVFVLPQADGSLLLVDQWLRAKTVSPARDTISDSVAFAYDAMFPATDIAQADDGTLYVLTNTDGGLDAPPPPTLRQYSPDGDLLTTIDLSRELPVAALAWVDGQRVVVLASGISTASVTLIDFALVND